LARVLEGVGFAARIRFLSHPQSINHLMLEDSHPQAGHVAVHKARVELGVVGNEYTFADELQEMREDLLHWGLALPACLR
jgi:hypothetical protein